MEKDRGYLKYIQGKEAEQIAEENKNFYETYKAEKKANDSFNNIEHIKATLCQLLWNDAIEQRELDLLELPEIHKEAAKAKSYEVLFYCEAMQAGFSERDIARIVSDYKTFNTANKNFIESQIAFKRKYKDTHNDLIMIDKKDVSLARKQLDKAIKEYENTAEPAGAAVRKITNHRLKQLPFIRALIDLYKMQNRTEEADELITELETLRAFIESVQDGTTKDLFIHRYEKALEWQDVVAHCLGTGHTEEAAKKKVQRYLQQYNKDL